jgi:hypothetical protein
MDELRRMIEALPPPPRSRASRRLIAYLAIALLAAAASLFLVWLQGSEERAVRDLPAADRASLYRHTLGDLQTVCATPHASDLDAHCREQARFILYFPDCDEDCGRLARWQLAAPTR